MADSSPLLVLITGANAGIGYYTAQHLARAGNFKILIGARTSEKAQGAIDKLVSEDSSLSKSVFEPLVIDLTQNDSIQAAADHVSKSHGHLDILINNAGISGLGESPKLDRETWQSIYNTNVIGTALVTDAFLPLLKKSTAAAPGRRIVNVSSELSSLTAASKSISSYHLIPYSASKSALNMLTVYTMHRVKEDKITVVMTTPGFCATNLNNFRGFKAPDVGARNVFLAATEGDFDSMNGRFTSDPLDGGQLKTVEW